MMTGMMKKWLTTFMLFVMALLPMTVLSGDFDDKMGYDDGFASPNEDMKMQTNVSYIKQKAIQQAAKAKREGEDVSTTGDGDLGSVVVDGNNYGDITIIMEDVGDVYNVQ